MAGKGAGGGVLEFRGCGGAETVPDAGPGSALDENLPWKRKGLEQEARVRALPLTASQNVPAREVSGTGTIGTAREMSLRRRSNVWHQRRA